MCRCSGTHLKVRSAAGFTADSAVEEFLGALTLFFPISHSLNIADLSNVAKLFVVAESSVT